MNNSTERIDGIVAAIMAIGHAMLAQEEPQPEYWSTRCSLFEGQGATTPSFTEGAAATARALG